MIAPPFKCRDDGTNIVGPRPNTVNASRLEKIKILVSVAHKPHRRCARDASLFGYYFRTRRIPRKDRCAVGKCNSKLRTGRAKHYNELRLRLRRAAPRTSLA